MMQVQDCKQLRKFIFLDSAGDVSECQETTFIQDKQHLESVLGQSPETWFETLTARQIQCRKTSSVKPRWSVIDSPASSSSVKPRWSVIDSPASSPTVSQLIRGQLAVGSSPAGLRHSSPAPYYEESFRARRSLGTPKADGWEKPLLGLSPGPSPIGQNVSVLTHPSSSGVYSLGMDDSTLSWTNSLATPPRDGSDIESQDSETESSSSRTKDTARALFSPGSRLDSTGDSVLPLDSTFEEDQSDMDGSQSDKSQSSLSQSNREGNQTKNGSFGTPDVRNISNILSSQEVQSKADLLKPSPTELKHMENWKENFKKRLISRKESLSESSKKFKSKNKSSPSISNDSKIDKKVIKIELDNKSPQLRCKSTRIPSHNDPEELSLSPTFSQKSSHSKTKSRKSPNVSRRERSSVDDVLSDFFDPPSASVGKRKPAPSRKRKSLEMEESANIVDSVQVVYNSVDPSLNVSTPQSALQSILASDKKCKSSSSKKVRFSENVKKCTFIPEPDSFLEKGVKDDKIPKKKRSCIKKVRTKDAVMQIKSDSIKEMPRNKISGDNAGKVGNQVEFESAKADTSSDLVIKTGSGKKDDTKTDKTLKLIELKNSSTSMGKDSVPNREKELTPYAENKGENSDNPEKSAGRAADENNEEDLFSQVSQSALNEMCDVAEKLVNNSINGSYLAKTLKDNVENNATPVKNLKAKRFFYPSVSHLVDATSNKVFQYREDESKNINRKVLLNSVKMKDVVDTDSDRPVEKSEHACEVKEHEGEEENENGVQWSNASDQNLNDIKREKLKDDTAVNDVEYEKNVESLTKQQFSAVCGFQSAAGRPVHIPQQALEKAATLLQEESKENESKKSVNDVHDSVKDVKQVYTHTELKKTIRNTLVEENQSSSGNVLPLPVKDFQKDFKNKYDEVLTKTEIKGRLKDGSHYSELDNPSNSFTGFQCASGKTLNIPPEAIAKAANLFEEDNLESKTNLEFKVLEENNGADLMNGLKPATRKNIDLLVKHTEAATPRFPDGKSVSSELTEDIVNDQSLNVLRIDSNVFKGFQSASGKELRVQDKALEKAASLLQEERFSPGSCSTICKEHIAVSEETKKETKEYGFEDDFMEDFEFSEWCDDEMEPSEDLLCVEDVKTDIGDIKEDIASSKVFKELKNVNKSKNEPNECAKKLVELNVETDVVNEKGVSTASDNVDENLELDKRALDKIENLSERLPVKENFEAVKQQNIEKDISKPLIDRCCSKDAELKLQETNKNIMIAYDQSKQDSKFVGFHTASGKSLNFNEERLKQAEKLLTDTNTDKVSSLDVSVDLDERERDNILPMNRLALQGNTARSCPNEKDRNVGFSSDCWTLKESLATKIDFEGVKGADISSKKAYAPRQKLSINGGKDPGRISVAERLKLEFEKELRRYEMENNSQSIENELKNLENFKKKREVQINQEKHICVDTGSKEEHPLKQFAEKTNKPKGFRPFKPPKITKLSNQDKYPQSKRKDWGNDTDNNVKVAKSSNEEYKDSVGKYITDVTKANNTDNPEMKISCLQTYEANQDRPGKCQDKVKLVNDRNIVYHGSTEKHDDSNVDLPKVNNDTSFNDIICMSNRNFAEANTSNIMESNCFDDSKTVGDSTVSISNADFDGFSQMFDEEMEFTEMVSVNDNGLELKCSRLDNADNPNSEKVDKGTLEPENNETKGKNTQSDVIEKIDGRENGQTTVKGVDIERKKKGFCNDFNENTTVNKGFVGFSTASGKAVCIPKKAIRSAAKLLSKCDENQGNTDDHYLDNGSETYFLKLEEENESYVGKSYSNENIGDKKRNKVVDKEGSQCIDSSHMNQTRNYFDDNKSFTGKQMKLPETIEEEVFRKFDQKCGDTLENGKLSENTLDQKYINPIPCFFQTASGKSVSISEAALKESKKSMDVTTVENMESLTEEIWNDSSNRSSSHLSNTSNGNNSDEDIKSNRGLKSNVWNEMHVLDTKCIDSLLSCKDKVKSVCSFQTASGKSVSISSEALKVAKQTLDGMDVENDVEEEKSIELCPLKQASSDDSVEISRKPVIDVNVGYMCDKIRNSSDDHIVPESLNLDEMKDSSVSTSSELLSALNPIKENVSVLKECRENMDNVIRLPESNLMPKFCGFNTASGKKVEVSEKALKYATETLASAEERLDSVRKSSKNEHKPANKDFGMASRHVEISRANLDLLKLSSNGNSELNLDKEIVKEKSKTDHASKVCGFSTASESNVEVSENALKHSKETLTSADESNIKVEKGKKSLMDNHFVSFASFSSTGREVDTSETTLKYAQETLADEFREELKSIGEFSKPGEVSNFYGFSTASGQKVEVSGTALRHAKEPLGNTDAMGEEFLDVSENDVDGYRQESFKLKKPGNMQLPCAEKCEKALKAIKTTIEISPLEKNPDFVGFSTASGKRVQVSDKALKHAKKALANDDETDNLESISVLFDCSVPSNSKILESQSTSNQVETNLAGDDFNRTENRSGNSKDFSGFSTASGNKICVSEKAMKYAKEKLKDSDKSFERNREKPELVAFSTASGSKVCVSDNAYEKSDDSDEMMYISDTRTEFTSFSTASGNAISVSESALTCATEKLVDTDKAVGITVKLHDLDGFSTASQVQFTDGDKAENVPKFDGFSTPSGTEVKVSEKAHRYAKGQFTDVDGFEKVENVPEFVGFSTASGTKVQVSEKALKYAKGQFTDGDDSDKAENVPKFDGFSTASGTKVQVSERALRYAKGQFTDGSGLDKVENVPKFVGFSIASGTKVQVSEKALRYARGQLTDDVDSDETENILKFDGFSTASGTKVEVSEKALKFVQRQLTDDWDTDKADNVAKFDGISTASGTKVQVSEKALKYAKGQFTDGSGLDKVENVPKFVGFNTASGTKVQVSEKALEYARGQLTYDVDSDETENILKFDGFSTASETKVEVSEKALKFVQRQLTDDWDTDKADNVAKFDGFSTASGTIVQVSEKALKYAKGQFTDGDDSDKAENVPKFDGFSTASGTKVQVSEKSLKYAKGKFKDDVDSDEAESVPKFVGFSTASGTAVDAVEISEEALKHGKDGCMEESNAVSGSSRPDNHLAQLNKDENESEGMGEDLEVVFGMAMKRRKLDMRRERKLVQNLSDEGPLSRRKPVKSTHAVAATDKRHPGFRPFKPVFCKSLDNRAVRQEVQHNSPGKPNFGVKSSFQTPYRNTPEKPDIASDKLSPAKSGSVSIVGHGDGSHRGQLSGKLNTSDMYPSGDCKEKHYTSVNQGSEESEKLSTSVKPVSQKNDFDNKNQICRQEKVAYDDSKPESSKTFNECTVNNGANQQTLDSKGNNNVNIETVSIDTKENLNTEVPDAAQASQNNEFDSFSQDEDDVYYCMLVEARRHQDDIIKGKAANRVRPVVGKLWNVKQRDNKWKLRDVVDRLDKELERPLHVTSGSAANHKFSMESHYGKNMAHISIGDRAYLVPDDAGKIGKEEFYRAFLTVEGVDAKLISESWVYNHYRWIVWKLAAYENTSTCLRTRSLTPEMVMLQLKYRYDREVDFSQRSAIKKIYERDDTPSKRLVLCVAAIKRYSSDGTAVDQSKPTIEQKVLLELTDGWYSIPTQIDWPLSQLVLNGRIRIGQKLCITGADLVGGEDACTPLEASSSIMLKICRNSTRPAPWDSILGYQRDPRPLCIPLSGLDGEGGVVGMVDVVIVRKYPTLYMEKFEGGGCIYRTSRCEDRARQEFETEKQQEMEKVYRQMENMAEKEEKMEKKKKSNGLKKFSRVDIENLQTGQDIYEAMEEAAQPDMMQNYLSDEQLSMLYEYQRQVQEQKQVELNSKFQRAWQEKLETFPERSVTPVLKFRVAGCANRDLDLKTSTILTVWRPASEISDLQEGHRYKIYSLNTSVSRSKYTGHTVQLTATKQTRFRRMQLDENILDNIYEAREVLWVSDIRRRQPPFGELDFVGIVVKITQSSYNDRLCDIVYLADCQTGILAVRFLNGYKSFGEDLFKVGQALCCSNLMDKSPYRYHHIPTVEVSSEFTHITNSSQNAAQRKALAKLNSVTKDKTGFVEKAVAMLENVSSDDRNQSIPKKVLEINEDFKAEFPRRNVGTLQLNTGQSDLEGLNEIYLENNSFESIHENHKAGCKRVNIQTGEATSSNSDNIDNSDKEASESNRTPVVDSKSVTHELDVTTTPVIERKRSIAQLKMSRLMSYGSPSVLSPLSAAVPRSVSKGFKPPAFKKL
ncbi:uncharacterized protein LOC123565454 [Mercenaria mercenaria]|uniref:uncharacterized protein LOC123565454 n=1 Tax=Mercenaria mercenaria TaxID=6596 RepID=UPI00234E747B|nr:uncharacterized protein LOC123565454 [Mercenaria mercenaria]